MEATEPALIVSAYLFRVWHRSSKADASALPGHMWGNWNASVECGAPTVLNKSAEGKSELVCCGDILRVGDWVIQRVNYYQREVFNEDLNIVIFINLEEQNVIVLFAEHPARHDYANIGELALIWAIAIHKS